MIEYTPKLVQRSEVKDFIETHHYSHSINGIVHKYCFAAYNSNNDMVIAAIFGSLGMANVWKSFAENIEDVIELKRLVAIDQTKHCTESWFIGWCLRWLRLNTQIKYVVSYADMEYGHTGVIYRASNFKYLYKTKPQRVIHYQDRVYHDKSIRTKYKGKLKPFAKKIKAALELGTASYYLTKGKVCYLYTLRK